MNGNTLVLFCFFPDLKCLSPALPLWLVIELPVEMELLLLLSNDTLKILMPSLPPSLHTRQGLLPSLVTSPISFLWPEGVLSLMWYLCWVLMGKFLKFSCNFFLSF